MNLAALRLRISSSNLGKRMHSSYDWKLLSGKAGKLVSQSQKRPIPNSGLALPKTFQLYSSQNFPTGLLLIFSDSTHFLKIFKLRFTL